MRYLKFFVLFILTCWTTSTFAGLFWYDEHQSFEQFIRSVSSEALQRNISPSTVRKAFDNIQLVNINRPLDPNKHYKRMGPGFRGYLDFSVTDSKITQGKELLRENHSTLQTVAKEFHVSPRVIVALWGLETDYGRLQGDYPEIATLATLAYGSHRHHFFREELMSALIILDQGKINIDKMTGSWAGAMGQCQFLPEEYLKYAVDYNHDGHRDIWHNKADVFATMANYLRHLGWNDKHGLVIPVKLPPHFYSRWHGLSDTQEIGRWNYYGVRDMADHLLPKGNALTAIVSPDGVNHQSYLVYIDNFHAVYRWNHSTYYVLSVGMLANRLRE